MQTTIDPTLERRPERRYVGIPIRASLEEWSEVNELFPEILGWVAQKEGVELVGAPFIRYRVIGDEEREYDVEVGAPVAGPVSGDNRVRVGTMPAGTYATVIHTGHPDQLFDVDAALQRWADAEGLSWATRTEDSERVWRGRFESFLTNPQEQPDPSKWSTELAYLLQDEGDDVAGPVRDDGR